MVLVSDLMDRADLGVQAVLLPAPRAALTWVVATELLQPASYLEGGELVLTTGLVMADAEAGTWREYVASLVEAGVAALGLGTGIAFDTVPEDLREACRIGRLNLLEVPLEVSFASISREVGAMLQTAEPEIGAEGAGDEETLVLQQLTRAAAKDNQSAIMRALASILRGEVSLRDAAGRTVVGPFGPVATGIDDEVAECIDRIRPGGMRGAGAVGLGDDMRLVVRPVGITGEPESYLVTVQRETLTRAQTLGVDLAWSFLNLIAESSKAFTGWLLRLVGAAAEHLLAGEVAQGLALADQVQELVLTRLPSPERRSVSAAGGGHQWRVICLEGGSAAVAGLSTVLARLLVERRGAAVGERLLWRTDRGGDRLTILGEAERVPALLEDGRVAPWTRRMRIGVSGPTGITDLQRGAQQALSVCTGARQLGQAVRWEASGLPSVTDLLDEDRARAFARARLGGVIDQPELLELLEVYLSEAGAVQRIAERLGVHRNSVPARLVRLRRALGVDVEDAEQRANLWFALHFLAE
ncbi:PucR family transcriptional regulator [Actinomyces naeslundii]|uniref:Transcriptional regulator n=3 Tax=Actinomyces naeslundii TaxID=1655 RepID=A0A854D7T4_ACTNA|nr:PucR family transcriptional regulator [Actinomyces naeslundii]OMG27631.1 transcriptional regulator [Actinomyces naeslundii]OMG29580.1 transcriptional regulator [Actinomyces naeslundii]OMG35006.1 transcriptional regulator [Actinomyces naeslundii]OMG36955.1 transcriptional regulator [Actinomyces naeslundii]OMG37154.1 transcriptional regulator [Actinomyces naeslundii]